MKDSQLFGRGGHFEGKYIKADNERFSTLIEIAGQIL